MPTITAPTVRYAPHTVTTKDIAAAWREHHSDNRDLKVWLRMVQSAGIDSRPWLRPLEETGANEGVGPRSRAAYDGARELALAAAREALKKTGLNPGDVGAIVTSHTSSYTVPGLDVDLVRRLGLRPDVARVGLSTVACAGGAQALIQADRLTVPGPASTSWSSSLKDSARSTIPGANRP
ncbi:hypothetical protein [Streptomyces sp. SM12]|uniref:hypothetical protein n=1 Tax=Streptomyces sp. SM12 TaxID=1071602 RepID=UPI000CD54FC0|nr:hypothetical protein [Streptomyces sp. SM12]